MSKPKKQRLTLFLDGTWNTEDDGTNVLNSYHLTNEGLIEGEDVIQKRYYDRGVGTSTIGKILGGGLGLGLEKNVREAYHWLVDNYNDCDEIYIFGFSRGAYTARSLVGLIAACGLVRRGAPITINQLWRGYAFISKHRDTKQEDWWASELRKAGNENYFRRYPDVKGNEKLHNQSERLVKEWSRRVGITYLGIFDTVAALGIDSLGIPGIESGTGNLHNVNPSRIIESCRHALAIDEYRPSFRLTPFLDYIPNEVEGAEKIDSYKGIIAQRWFVGAHANVGGGYPNNVLSVRPFEWIMEGANKKGLATSTEKARKDAEVKTLKEETTEVKVNPIRDSFASMGYGAFPQLIREKRNLRPIGRRDDVRVGSTLRTIDESVDESVFEFGYANSQYAPANLLAYLKQNPDVDQDDVFTDRKVQQRWPGEALKSDSTFKKIVLSPLILILWSVLAATGCVNVFEFLWREDLLLSPLALGGIAAFFVLIDRLDAYLTIKANFSPVNVVVSGSWNIVYWLKWVGVIAVLTKIVGLLVSSLVALYEIGLSFTKLKLELGEYVKNLWGGEYYWLLLIPLPVVIVLSLRDHKRAGAFSKEETAKIDPKNILALIKSGEKPSKGKRYQYFMIVIVSLVLLLWANSFQVQGDKLPIDKLPLVYLLWGVFIVLTSWVGKPIRNAKLPDRTTLKLQGVFSYSQLTSLLGGWVEKLSRKWMTERDESVLKTNFSLEREYSSVEKHKLLAWLRLKEVLRLTLWRDILGYTPIYSLVFGGILFVGSMICYDDQPPVVVKAIELIKAYGLSLIIVTAVADWIENVIHLNYIRSLEKEAFPRFLPMFGILATGVKFIGFFTVAFLSLMITIALMKGAILNPKGWWYNLTAIMTYVLLLSAMVGVIRFIGKTVEE